MNDISLKTNGCSLSLNTSIYSLEAIKKAAYKFADRASILISPGAASSVIVEFNFRGKSATDNLGQVVSDFSNELLDQDLREIVKRETVALRNLIMAQAFSRTTLAEKS
jgi:His-Xaa-Ser system protein HxsD